jgi:hypothetical protein
MKRICAVLFVLMVLPRWAGGQEPVATQPSPAAKVADTNDPVVDDRMLAPPPVSGQAYPVTLTSEERSNFLRGGLVFTAAYSDNVTASSTGQPISDMSYSVTPTLALEKTTPRMLLDLSFAPGFTFYQKVTALNQSDQNFGGQFTYRLSPHVTFSVGDTFQKSSNAFSQPGAPQPVTGGPQGPNFSVVAPYADRLTNFGNVGITYQFARNQMVGGSGTFSNLHYPNPSQAQGLADTNTQAGSGFYSVRVANRSYVGAMYLYQRLVATPTIGTNETQTNAILGFYTFYPSAKLSLSLFGGPQYASTVQPSPLPKTTGWSPAAGASMNWQAQHTNFAASYAHTVASGSGLEGAVQLDNVNASVRQQITKTTTGTLAFGYVQNNLIGIPIGGSQDGHSVFGTASVQQQFGRHLGLQLGYTRLNQVYTGIPSFSTTPDTNRGFISLSYQFERALGR